MTPVLVAVAVAAVPVLTALGWACLRIASWHDQEAAYWHHVALLVRLDPGQDAIHRPVLVWVQANRPSHLQRLRAWAPPPVRMESAGSR